MKLLSLRVTRGAVGRMFPFDRVYLAPTEDHAVFAELFRYALVLPLQGHIKDMMTKLAIDASLSRSMERNSAEENPVPLKKEDWSALLEETEWTMAVPINAKYNKKMSTEVPRYLISEKWYRGARGANRPENLAFDTKTYLQTPKKNIKPVCLACPRIMLHYAGDCKLGDSVCYSHMGLGGISYFKEGLAKPEAPVTEADKEISEKVVQLGRLPSNTP